VVGVATENSQCQGFCVENNVRMAPSPKKSYRGRRRGFQETLNKSILFVVRQAHHERNHPVVVRPELVEGSLSKDIALRFLRVNRNRPRDISRPPFSSTIIGQRFPSFPIQLTVSPRDE